MFTRLDGPFALLAAGALLMGALFFVVWAISVRIKNAGIVDIAWAFGFTPLAALYGALGSGDPNRRLLIGAMTVLWSLRLTSHLYVRVMGEHPREDGRYQELRRRWGGNVNLKFLVFFLFQAALDVVLAAPLLLACRNVRPGITVLEWLAAVLFLVALAGETVADRQLSAWKADPAHEGRVCNVGLWRYSRHPNYFFEWLVWCAYFLFALGAPWGWVTIYCPALMLYFLFKVTGIPATEAQAVRSKGDLYREYQRTTSVFVPLPPRA